MKHFVYIIKSIKFPKQIYIGYTGNFKTRIKSHNNGQVTHTSKFKPWRLIACTEFSNRDIAISYEKYLKSGSGRQFIYKHFL